jgi:hypothetical protein
VSVLDGFLTTWSNARETFGQGVPASGEQFDQSGPLRDMQSTVQTAAPGAQWSGNAASAYGAANTKHGEIFSELATLDQRLGAKVDESANVVATGRQNLDSVRQWVLDAAASVPPGKNREQLLMPIVSNGLGQVNDIITTSNGELNRIGREIQGIGSGFDALDEKQFKQGTGDGDAQNVVDEKDGDGEPKPEDMEGLVHDALNGDQEAATKVDGILDSINDQQLGPNSKQNPLTPVQAELVGQMQAQMKPMSMDDLNAARDRLGPNKNILGDAMQVMSDPDVTYPRHDGDGMEVVPSTPGGPLPNNGVLPGDRGALPDGVQATLNEGGKFDGPPGPQVGYPGAGPTDFDGPAREQAANNMKDLANIVGDGDPRFQQGTELDRGMMSSAKEWLNSQEGPDGQEHWGDDVVQRVFETAGRDTVVDHDMLTTDNDFRHDVFTHEWADDGKSASTLTNWIDDAAHSSDPLVAQRAGETASGIADYLGDPANKDALMNINGGSTANQSMGQMNPELTRSLAQAMSPYVDEMAGRDLDGTSGWKPIDNLDADRSMPHAAQVFGVLGTDDVAASTLETRSAVVQHDFVNTYANSVIDSNGHSSDSSAMEAAGRLKGITGQGAFMAMSDTGLDATKAQQAAWDRMARNYDLATTAMSNVPTGGPALELGSMYLKEALLGPRPEDFQPGQAPVESSVAMRSALASTFMAHNFGDPGDINALREFDTNGDGILEPPDSQPYGDRTKFDDVLQAYYNRLGGVVGNPLDLYEQAYRDVIR